MLALSSSQWTRVLSGVLVAGTLFVAATRVRPAQTLAGLSPVAEVASDPAPQTNHPAPHSRCRCRMGRPFR